MKKVIILILTILFLSITSLISQNYVQVGTGSQSTNLPPYLSWNYSWSSMIFKAEDIGAAKDITHIGFDVIPGSEITLNNQTVYLKLVDDTSFANTNYEAPENNGYTKVYEGTIDFQSGWCIITLNAPFSYDGSKHIALHWENEHGTQNSSKPNFNGLTVDYSSNRVKVFGADNALPTTTGWGFTSMPNIRFYYQGNGPATPNNIYPTQNLTDVFIDDTLSWTLGANTHAYDLYFGTDSSNLNKVVSNGIPINGTNSYIPITLLNGKTNYFWYVVAKDTVNATQETSPIWKFTTEPIIETFPYNQGFEDSTVFAPYPLEGNWTLLPNGTEWYRSDDPHTGNHGAKVSWSHNGGDAIMQSPRIVLPNNHRIVYYWKENSFKAIGHDTTFFEISTDRGDTWITIDSIFDQSISTYTEKRHDLTAYANEHVYIRFRDVSDNSSSAGATYIDDILIHEINTNPVIQLSLSTYSFDEVYINGKTYFDVAITNTGGSNLEISGVTVDLPFSSSYNGIILPNETDTARIYINGDVANNFADTLYFDISGNYTGNNGIELSGSVLENNDMIFESFDASLDLPAHWNVIRNEDEMFHIVEVKESNLDSYSQPNIVRMLNANDTISPLLFITKGVTNFDTHKLSFYAKAGGNYNQNLYVGIMQDPYHYDSFIPIDTFALADTFTYCEVTDINTQNTKPYIAFMHGQGGTFQSIWIDDVSWESSVVAPPNCPLVAKPVDSAINQELTPTLRWANGGGNTQGYKLYFGTNNPPSNIINGIDVNAETEYIIADTLTYSTTYFWKVIAYNTAGETNGCEVWQFSTMDDPTITDFPWVENFDDTEATSDYDYPLGWSMRNVNDDTHAWDIIQNNANAPDNAHSAPNAMHIEFDFANQMDDWLFTPPLLLQGGESYDISFWCKVMESFGTIYEEKLEVKWGTYPAPDRMNMGTIYNNDSIVNITYEKAINTIQPINTGKYYIGFHGYSDPFKFLLLIDDVSVMQTTDIAETNTFDNVKIYPNPISNNQFAINWPLHNNYQCVIYSSIGKQIVSYKNVKEFEILTIPNNLSNGVYFVYLLDKNSHVIKKIIIQ